ALRNDPEPRVQEAAHSADPAGESRQPRELDLNEMLLAPHPGLLAAQTLEAQLDANPAQGLEVLRPLLGKPGILVTLSLLGEMARNQSNRLLCRALHALYASRQDEPARRLLRVLGILSEETGRGPSAQLKRLVWVCIQAFDADSLDKMIEWGHRLGSEPLDGLPESSHRPLSLLSRLASNLGGGFGMTALAEATTDLQGVGAELARYCLDPEKEILQMVVDRWSQFFAEGMHELLVGVNS
ncbi:MAG: hypothetical protein AB1758_32450, partial [Candidatus Eremiobacterota bacterium]